MRSILFTAVMCLLCCANTYAQTIMGYTFESTNGSYSEITDGTSMNNPEGLAFSDGLAWMNSANAISETTTGTGFDIGFDFLFNDQYMNKFAIGANFALFLGKDEFTINPARHRWFLGDSDEDGHITHNVIMSAIAEYYNVECGENTEISYKIVGEAPNRSLVVQYKDVVVQTTGYVCDLQIRLNETINTIDIVYHGWNDQWTEDDKYVSMDICVGIKGNDGDAQSRGFADEDEYDWSNTFTEYGEAILVWGMENSPEDGLTFTFTPGSDCTTPTVQASDLELEIGSTVINGSFTPAEEGADRYLILLAKGEASAEDMPNDGLVYKRLDTIGNSIVLGFTNDTVFTTLDKWGEAPEVIIEPETQYCITVLAVNSLCSHGPKYNLSDVLQKHVTSAPAVPTMLKITDVTTDMIEIAFTGNESKHDVMIAYTDVPLRMDPHVTWVGTGVFGTPKGDLNVGDEIEGGGIVCYVGPADGETKAKIENLNSNTVYHFSAWSKNENNEYSSDTICASNITDASVPFEFDMEAIFGGCEFGVTMDGFSVTNDKAREYVFYLSKAKANTDYTVTTQWLTPANGINRLMFDFTIWKQTGSSWMPTINPFIEWADGEEFVVESSTDEETWSQLITINKDNAPIFEQAYEYSSQIATFESDGTPVRIRIRYTCKTAGTYAYLKDFRIEEKKDCDYPIDLAVKEISGDKATITWEQQGEETEWYAEWRIAENDTWNSTVTDSKELALEGLPGRSIIEVRVAAKCSESESSDWSRIMTFTSGYVLPFTEDFSDENLSPEWEFKTGELTDTGTEFEDGGWYATTDRFGKNLIMLEMPSAPVNAWVLSPTLDFGDGDVNYILSYKLTSLMSGGSSDETVKIVVSTDGGETFNTSGVVLSENAPADGESQEYTATLKGLKGNCRLGLLLTCTTGYASYLQLESMSVTESCPTDVVVSIDDIQESSATVSWTGTKDDDKQWMVFIRKSGDTSKDYILTDEFVMTFDELEARTSYEVGVTKACAEDDIARPVIASFTTLAEDLCLPVEESSATPEIYDVTLEWPGEAYSYNIRYREETAEEWKEIKDIKGNTYTIGKLRPESTYAYQIQTVCSPAENDYSDWSTENIFTTLDETCITPANIKIETTYNSAVVSWEGTSCSYEIEYRAKNNEESVSLNVTELNVTITDLEAATDYELRLRGLCPDQDQTESLWTEFLPFSTEELPACDAPTELAADVSSFLEEKTVALSWLGDEAHLSWEVRYRDANSTSWETIEDIEETTVTLENLVANTKYLWNVRAYCVADRVTSWSAQGSFETPKGEGIVENEIVFNIYPNPVENQLFIETEADVEEVSVYDVYGRLQVTEAPSHQDVIRVDVTDLNSGIYFVKVRTEKGETVRRILKF